MKLTEFWSFAEDEGVGPELADGSVVETLVADGVSEAAGAQDVGHVGTGPNRSDDAAKPQSRKQSH